MRIEDVKPWMKVRSNSPVAKHFNSSCRPQTHVDKKKEMRKNGGTAEDCCVEEINEEEDNERNTNE